MTDRTQIQTAALYTSQADRAKSNGLTSGKSDGESSINSEYDMAVEAAPVEALSDLDFPCAAQP